MISSNQVRRQRRYTHWMCGYKAVTDRGTVVVSHSVSIMHFSLGLAFLILGFREDMLETLVMMVSTTWKQRGKEDGPESEGLDFLLLL